MGFFDEIKKVFRFTDNNRNGNENNNVFVIGNFEEFMKGVDVSIGNFSGNEIMYRPVTHGFGYPFSYTTQKPMLPYLFFFSEVLVYNSDVLRSVIRCIVWETFRNGLYIKERFVLKCKKCGAEYNEVVEQCSVCGSKKFRKPNIRQKMELEKWIRKANINEQTLIRVCEDLDWALNVFDNAYVIVRKRYLYNDEGRIVGAEPIEIIAGDVKRISLVMSEDGRLGMNNNGELVFVCPEHRKTVVTISPKRYEEIKEKGDFVRCPVCGKEMLLAYAEYGIIGGSSGESTNLMTGLPSAGYLCAGEILHVKKFTPGVGYGFPMPMTLSTKILTLIYMDWYVNQKYRLGRPPKGILIIKANRDSVAKAWQMLMEKARRNPHEIYPLVIEGYDKAGKVAEWIDLSLRMDETSWISYRDELRRMIGIAYGVSPVFQGDLSTGVGLANEGLQITVTNRAVEQEQKIFNEIVFPFIVKQLGITDWEIRLKPHEEKDMKAQLERIRMRLDIVDRLIDLGYAVKLYEGVDGIEFRFEDMKLDDYVASLIKKMCMKKGIKVPDDKLKEFVESIDEVIKNWIANPGGNTDDLLGGIFGRMSESVSNKEGNESNVEENDRRLIQILSELFENEPEESRGRVYGRNREFEGMPEDVKRENYFDFEGSPDKEEKKVK